MSRLAAAVAPGRSLEQAAERAGLAEQVGYESVWLTQLPTERDSSIGAAGFEPTLRAAIG
jgi:hypothetical protein